MADAPDDLGSVPPGGTADHADRLHGLIDAHRAITTDTDLSAMLGRIVSAACRLVGAGYGVLGVLTDDGTLDHSVQYGKLTGPTATRAVLEVPIRVGSTVFGNLFLAEPQAEGFSFEDEELAGALAAMAGTAVKDAQLFLDVRRSSEWLTASGEIARSLLHEEGTEILPLVVQRAVEVAEADYGTLIIPTPDGRLRAMHTVGVGSADFRGLVFSPSESGIGRAVVSGQSVLIDDMTRSSRPGFVNRWNYGPAMVVPLVDGRGVRGAVLVIRTADRRPFIARDAELASTFAAQVALALQFDDARVEREQLHALEIRHQIAQELHDNVIQRLFAIGVGLQSVQNLAVAQLDPTIGDRLARHIRDLDETIDEIRTRVFGLRQDGTEDASRFPHLPPGAAGPDAEN
jgi:two-component system, NarL family, sensor histidine kinase DevS